MPVTETMNAAEAVLRPALAAGHARKAALKWRDQTISYEQLHERVLCAAAMLRAQGVEPEQRVALMLKDYPGLVYAYLGAMAAGAVPIAINLRASAVDLAHILADSRARLLILDREFMLTAQAALDRFQNRPAVILAQADNASRDAWMALVGRHEPMVAPTPMSRDDMAFWIYTSGTTGTPKAAVHTHKDVLTATDYTSVLGLGPGDTVFATSKLFFAYSLGNAMFAALQKGATTVLLDAWPTPDTVADIVEAHKPTLVFSVPTLYRNMLERNVVKAPAFKQVRHYVSAGERLPEELWRRWKEATGVAILDGMGTSETIYMLLTNRPDATKPGSSGQPVPNVECKLADALGAPVAAGEPGILWAKTPSRADRYWNAQAKSQEAFPGAWFRTGDMYTVDAEGYWHHQGRADDMLKISGQWVSPGEIEEAALAHAGVKDACALGFPDTDGLPRVALFVVPPQPGANEVALAENIRAALKAHLSPYKIPKWIKPVPEIPRTATGKAQRFVLRQKYESAVR
jgi:3-hydroxybenzoate/4-hydroxybenzoate---CoA ligase